MNYRPHHQHCVRLSWFYLQTVPFLLQDGEVVPVPLSVLKREKICDDHPSLTNTDYSESTYQLISGTVHFLAPLKRAVGSVVGHDLLFNGGGVVAPWSHLNHALQVRVKN